MNIYKIRNIKWDTDDDTAASLRLPAEVTVESVRPMSEDDISDLLSDRYVFCHNGFDYEQVA